MIDPKYLFIAIGYSFAIAGGRMFITPISDALWRGIGWTGGNDPTRPGARSATMIGVVERVLYTTSWLVGKPEFVAVWLALKVAGQWSRWTGSDGVTNTATSGRPIFNIFLIGNAFSIAYGLAGGVLVEMLSRGAILDAILVASTLVIGSLAFRYWASTFKAAA